MTGRIETYPHYQTDYVADRQLEIWFPEAYDQEPERRFPVLYMHDGQNLFNPATAYDGVPWAVDRALSRLVEAGQARPAIIVGVWHGEQRWRDYLPRRPMLAAGTEQAYEQAQREVGGDLMADNYLRFLTAELKPWVDSHYRTLPERPDTFVMGSSMGGLISLYALCEYPAVFGGAGCVSTHWPALRELMLPYLKANLPAPGTHRIYFDYGTETLDAEYEPYQRQVDAIIRDAGYREGEDWITRKFEGHAHAEPAWQQRVHIPLKFLLSR